MGVLGVSLIVASVLWVIVRPPPWLTQFLLTFRGPRPAIGSSKPPGAPRQEPGRGENSDESRADEKKDTAHAPSAMTTARPSDKPTRDRAAMPPPPVVSSPSGRQEIERTDDKTAIDRAAMPPPPVIRPPIIENGTDGAPTKKAAKDRAAMPPPPIVHTPSTETKEDGEQTTPKATPSQPRAPVPEFSLPVPSFPAANSAQRVSSSVPSVPSFPAANSPQRASSNSLSPTPNRLPSLAPSARPNPLPNRGPPTLGSSLAPPPTHSTKPAKPSRKVMLSPGHSPLDWAAISGPNADLRNLPPATPYLRVTPSMLKKQNGRKGNDAWMVLGGRVYNVTPYAKYHPGGVPELMRGAGKDGTKLFGEVHPWVNYEGMLQACLVGVYVGEDEKSAMDDMD